MPAAFKKFNLGVGLGRVPAGDWSFIPIIELNQAELDVADEVRQTLGYGGAECIAIAHILKRGRFLMIGMYAKKRQTAGLSYLNTGCSTALVHRNIVPMPESVSTP